MIMGNSHDQLVRTKKVVALARACSVPIDHAIKVALMKIGGTVVDAKLKGKPEKVHWRIKVLTAEGPVKVYIDGRSGEILEAWSEGSLPLADVLPKEIMVGHSE
jgi:uncharacterized membrane protein YkoI